jgi:hypothetical protein
MSTLRDTHDWRDWLLELRYPSLSRIQVLANKLYEDNPLVQRAVRRADRVYTAAEFLREKAARKYRLRFGVPVPDDDFNQGLRQLLQGDRWRQCGERARSYIAGTFERDLAVGRHLTIYEAMLEQGR